MPAKDSIKTYSDERLKIEISKADHRKDTYPLRMSQLLREQNRRKGKRRNSAK
jgi:hypothetical protein